MTDITSSASGLAPSQGLRDVLARIAPRKPRRFDPLGLVSGYRAYVVYSRLSALSDRQLADLGIERSDIARIAVSAI